MPSRRLHLFIVLFLAILALFLSLATFLLLFQPIKTLTRLGEGVEEAKKRFVSIAFPLLREERMELRMILNESHIEKARELGISDLDSEEKVRIACKKGKLVRLTDNRFWRIQELTHSLPYVTPDTYRLLVLIGARFQDALKEQGLPVYRYCISSVLRTKENHKDLQKINRNASPGESSHEYGTTVDILFREFEYSASSPLLFRILYGMPKKQEVFHKNAFDALGMEYAWALRNVLAKVLIELQREGKCYVILERRQPVFHITLATRKP